MIYIGRGSWVRRSSTAGISRTFAHLETKMHAKSPAGLAFGRSMADLLCHRSFCSCYKDN